MREILFRGKRLDNGEWLYGSYHYKNYPNYKGEMVEGHYIAVPDKCYNRAIDPNTVGQYTGLTDANGKRIFEDDFVQMKSVVNGRKKVLLKGFVKYEADAFYAHFTMYGRRGKGLLSSCTSSFHMEDEGLFCEVIGNIHDNPELLGGADNG